MARILFAQPMVAYDWLFGAMRRCLGNRGHAATESGRDADVVFFESRVGFDPFDAENLNIAIARRIPVVVFDYLEYHACGHALKSHWFEWYSGDFSVVPDAWAHWVRQFFKAGLVRVYFLKYMQASEPYPEWVYPIDYAYRPEWERPEVTYDEFAARPYDVCLVGMASQPKATSICHFLESRRLRVSWDWYQPRRYPQEKWISRYRQAKFFLESEGWGPSDKPLYLAWVAAMLRQNADYHWAHDWQDGKDCVQFGDFMGVPNAADIDRIEQHCRHPEALYGIYRAGREAVRSRYNEQAVTDYVDGVIKRHGIA